MSITFTMLYRRKLGTNTYGPVVRFTRETSYSAGRILDVVIWPSGAEERLVNCKSVEELPDLPSAKELLACVARFKDKAMAILAAADDSPEQRAAYWDLVEAMKGQDDARRQDDVQAVADAEDAPEVRL